MLIAKFVPGLTTVMPPLAGIFAVRRPRFVFYELTVCCSGGIWIGIGLRLQRCDLADRSLVSSDWSARSPRRSGHRGSGTSW